MSEEMGLMEPVPVVAVDVENAADVAAAGARLSGEREIAVDVESDSMHAFRARLCFVQIGTDRDIFLLDTLVPEVQMRLLAPVFANAGCTKYFHAAGGDLSFLHAAGVRVQGLFDTHRAATLLGLEKVGLADLVRQELGVELPKEYQKADFSIRPLAPAVRDYIANDVRYLCAVGRRMEAACREKDILEETWLDCARMEFEAQSSPDSGVGAPQVPRKAQTLTAWRLAQAVADELHGLRLQWAEAADVPAGMMLSKAAILDLAVLRPVDFAPVLRLGHLQRSFVHQHGEETLAAIRMLEQRFASMEAEPGPEPGVAGEQQERNILLRKSEDALKAFRTAQAVVRGVTPSVVLPNALIADILAAAPREVADLARLRWFGEKRLALYGQGILNALLALR